MKKDNKNVAIGKSSQLGGCLEWLPNDDRYYTYSKKDSIRALFIERMGELLPRKARNPKAFAAIHLPTTVGGYGLGLKRDTKKWLEASPEPTQYFVFKLFMGQAVKKDLRILRQLNTNTSRRGVTDLLDYQEELCEKLNRYAESAHRVPARFRQGPPLAMNWWELKHLFPADNAKRTVALAADNNILSVEEFVKRVTRGNLFQELLIGTQDLKVFNTNKYVDTYRKVVWPYWEATRDPYMEPFFDSLSSEQIASAIQGATPLWFIDISRESVEPILFTTQTPTGEIVEQYRLSGGSLIKLHTQRLPSLNIPRHRLGVKL